MTTKRVQRRRGPKPAPRLTRCPNKCGRDVPTGAAGRRRTREQGGNWGISKPYLCDSPLGLSHCPGLRRQRGSLQRTSTAQVVGHHRRLSSHSPRHANKDHLAVPGVFVGVGLVPPITVYNPRTRLSSPQSGRRATTETHNLCASDQATTRSIVSRARSGCGPRTG